jgi:LysR family glycine cleavage system transcriptional activator
MISLAIASPRPAPVVGELAASTRKNGSNARGAISQRVRSIEEQYGSRLFTRSRNGVALTKSGDTFWQDIRDAFTSIETAHAAHFIWPSAPVIRISAAPTYAYSSLVSSLGKFQASHPNVRLSVETEDCLVDLRSETRRSGRPTRSRHISRSEIRVVVFSRTHRRRQFQTP